MKRNLALRLLIFNFAFLIVNLRAQPAPEQAFICTICGTNTNARILFSTNLVNWSVIAEIHSPGPWAISVTETNQQGYFFADTNVCAGTNIVFTVNNLPLNHPYYADDFCALLTSPDAATWQQVTQQVYAPTNTFIIPRPPAPAYYTAKNYTQGIGSALF